MSREEPGNNAAVPLRLPVAGTILPLSLNPAKAAGLVPTTNPEAACIITTQRPILNIYQTFRLRHLVYKSAVVAWTIAFIG